MKGVERGESVSLDEESTERRRNSRSLDFPGRNRRWGSHQDSREPQSGREERVME